MKEKFIFHRAIMDAVKDFPLEQKTRFLKSLVNWVLFDESPNFAEYPSMKPLLILSKGLCDVLSESYEWGA